MLCTAIEINQKHITTTKKIFHIRKFCISIYSRSFPPLFYSLFAFRSDFFVLKPDKHSSKWINKKNPILSVIFWWHIDSCSMTGINQKTCASINCNRCPPIRRCDAYLDESNYFWCHINKIIWNQNKCEDNKNK